MTLGEFRIENGEDSFILLIRKRQQQQPLGVEARNAPFPHHDVASAFINCRALVTILVAPPRLHAKRIRFHPGVIKSPQDTSRRTFWQSDLQLCLCYTLVSPSAPHTPPWYPSSSPLLCAKRVGFCPVITCLPSLWKCSHSVLSLAL